jgi:molybdopterin synthase catalytic subunit
MRQSLWPRAPRQELEGDLIPLESTGKIRGLAAAVFVAERTDGSSSKLGGFVEVSLRPFAHGCATGPVGYVEAWYVDPDLRKQGVVRSLIEAAERWARERGCAEMASDCHDTNTVSYQSHLHLGYRPSLGSILFRKDLMPTEPSGRAASNDLIAIVEYGLWANVAVDFVTSSQAGGINVFLGTTRAETTAEGRELIALHYEAYCEMALKQMRNLAHRARERWPIIKLALLHRVGRVNLGEPSVIIAVATPHRGDAFEACRFLIDTLKAEVAIWKKEVWADGSTSWVDPGSKT